MPVVTENLIGALFGIRFQIDSAPSWFWVEFNAAGD